ncbi:uncharacterized protein [Epargyreus clarus]|uniref:uncharacterized protein n=1 Tax=Epargyreus clarus TaxID=520877 RepID=UPI003C2E83ED
MTIIAVDGFTHKVNLTQVVKTVAKAVQGHFEALNFYNHPDRGPFKTCYLKLSDRLDPRAVVERINNTMHAKKLSAYIPDSVPNMQVAVKRKAMPLKMRKRMRIHGECSPEQVFLTAHEQIMKEMQHKYTGLYSLSSKTSHKLLETIGVVIADRLKKLILSGDPNDQSFRLTSRYRKAHPHFGDFQLILSTLHRIQDASGTPRTQLHENELAAVPKDVSAVDNVPYSKAQEMCAKYTNNIVMKLQAYVNKYNLAVKPNDTEEDKARKTIQKQFANMMPYLPMMLKQVITHHFTPNNKGGLCRMIIYGEPYLPAKEASLPFLKSHRAVRAQRCPRMFNALSFHVTRDRYAKLLAANGTSVAGTKLIVRPARNNLYNMPHALRSKIAHEVAQAFKSRER